jgi:hypothetical protein
VIDAAGNPMIVYGYRGLQLAIRRDGEWDVREISSLRCGDVSIARKGASLVIGCYDDLTHGLAIVRPIELEESVLLPLVRR